MGSPLGDENVKKRLRGANASCKRKYPVNMDRWYNAMNTLKVDVRNYNLAVRKGKSNPHHDIGYLISPEVVKIVAEWLQS